ncbi:MAG: nicotinate (nicotinamide) nucleotide adenylyltransferase [Planctomycetota bacterium]
MGNPPPNDDSASAVALLGGVFDPPHQGHIDIGLSALQLEAVAEVIWIPCARIPHHKAAPVAPAEARLQMVERICSEIDGFTVDDLEFLREGPSYTVDTVRTLSQRLGDKSLLWIVGADNADKIAQWKSAEELWQMAIPVVAPRPGVETGASENPALVREDFPYIDDGRWQHFLRWQLPPVSGEISSSEIRSRLARAEEPRSAISEHPGIPAILREFLIQGGWYHTSSD